MLDGPVKTVDFRSLEGCNSLSFSDSNGENICLFMICVLFSSEHITEEEHLVRVNVHNRVRASSGGKYLDAHMKFSDTFFHFVEIKLEYLARLEHILLTLQVLL